MWCLQILQGHVGDLGWKIFKRYFFFTSLTEHPLLIYKIQFRRLWCLLEFLSCQNVHA